MDDLRPTRTREPDVSVVPAAVQLTAALVFVKERGQSPEQFSHEREDLLCLRARACLRRGWTDCRKFRVPTDSAHEHGDSEAQSREPAQHVNPASAPLAPLRFLVHKWAASSGPLKLNL